MANLFAATRRAQENPIPSSSPAFGTPAHPIIPRSAGQIPAQPQFQQKPATVTIQEVEIPPATLRSLAFRTFTKKHNLTLTSAALAGLANFIGKHCGARWRQDGLAEAVLEETAKMWKKESTTVIVDGDSAVFKSILKLLEPCMVGGKLQSGRTGLSRQGSFAFLEVGTLPNNVHETPSLQTHESFGMSGLEVKDDQEEENRLKDPREWIKTVSAFDQPRLVYNVQKKNFDKNTMKPSLLPPPTHKIEYFRQRYHIVHQRILRNESFQSGPDFASNADTNRITPIANLLGRSGSTHLLLGLLTISATGNLAISDLTGTIALDIEHARPVGDDDNAWFCPGMIVLIDGVYSEDYSTTAESALGNSGGIGGTIGGKFIASVVAHPPCERRATALGIQENTGPGVSLATTGPGFGWTDFLGVGSERATGSRMRKIESSIIGPGAPHAGNAKIAIASEINLDDPASLNAVRTLLSTYSALDPTDFPMSLVLIGNFVSNAAMAGAPNSGSIEYKEYFNALASVFSDFPQLVARLNIVFVPGDKDAWPSAFSAGAAAPLPQKQVPDLFTTRMKRVISEANREIGGSSKGRREGEVVWTSNPARLTWFGTAGEMTILRDDATGRLRRNALRFNKPGRDIEGEEDEAISGALPPSTDAMDVEPSPPVFQLPNAIEPQDPDTLTARRLTKTLLDQGHLSPFSMNTRPVHWDFGSALQLYPLPTALIIADPEAPPFSLNYMGCCVMNPGPIVHGRRGELARWVEFNVIERKGRVRVEDG